MKTINAFWEKRNLNANCVEVVLDKEDTINTVLSGIKDIVADYIVVKTPTCELKLYEALSKNGFAFAETLFHLKYSTQNDHLETPQLGYPSGIKLQRCSDKDAQKVFSEIDKGIFSTDRIYLDPYFKNQAAYNRYKNWLSDEIEKGALLFLAERNGEAIGFSAFKHEADLYNQFLVGIFLNYQNQGLGVKLIQTSALEVFKLGASRVITTVSSNNVPSLKAHQRAGYSIERMEYVFVKHVF